MPEPNGATPQPDEKAVTGCALDSFDNLIREIREIREKAVQRDNLQAIEKPAAGRNLVHLIPLPREYQV